MCLFNLFIIETINMMNTLISQNTSENECLIYKKENKKIINLDDYKQLKYKHFHDETL